VTMVMINIETVYLYASRPALGSTQSSIQWVPGALYLGLKRPENEVDRSSQSSSNFKCMELYLHSPIHLLGEVLN
jgi:hypothetical protein